MEACGGVVVGCGAGVVVCGGVWRWCSGVFVCEREHLSAEGKG